ncbi:MAG: cysteine desulfurase [bacterium]
MHFVRTDPLAWTRNDFPLLGRLVDGFPITHLDSASTAPKPRCVIEAVTRFYEEYTANVHRGVHGLSEEATELFERTRHEVASFLNASPDEIIFTRNTTESINLVAHGLGLKPDDEVILTPPEHHSNFMPWRVRARAVTVGLDCEGAPRYDDIESLMNPRTRLVTLAQISNTLGVLAPVDQWIAKAHSRNIPVVIDASQSASHIPIDVKALDCDFLATSGHKLLGPSGVGILYGKRERLEALSLYQTGGGMVKLHDDERFVTHDIPFRFEAGTPNIEGVIGLGAAVAYLRGIGMEAIHIHSRELGAHLVKGLSSLGSVRILAGSAPLSSRIGLVSFAVKTAGFSADTIARQLYDRYQILVSGGYHCAHILHHRLKLDGTVRASTHVFNTHADIEALIEGLKDLLDS